ncbi:MAG: PAS domain-containing sensor histidine kinase [Dongiaceae bacterium]
MTARARVPAPPRDMAALLRSTMDGLSAHVAVLDETGTIIAVNEAWRHFARSTGFRARNEGVGMNYLEVCERAAPASAEAARTAAALREVLGGRSRDFRLEYPCAGPDGIRWFQLRMTSPPQDGPPRIVMAHEEITEAKNAQEALARLSARLLQLQDEERRRIARELHDSTAQNLLAIVFNMTRLQEPLREARAPVPRILAETLGLAEQSLQEIRTLSYLLHPPLLDEIGLASAVRWYAEGFSERSGIAVAVGVDAALERLPAEVETALFRVLQEALTNIHRHAGSPSAEVALRRLPAAVTLEIADRGRGIPPGVIAEGADAGTVGVGISGMRLRLRQLGGRLEIRSGPGGTTVAASLPLAAPPRPRKRGAKHAHPAGR